VSVKSDSALDVAYSVTPGYSAVELPYSWGRLAALVVMPAGEALGSYVAGLTTTRLASVVRRLKKNPVFVDLPRFTLRTSGELSQVLQAMGMHDAFQNADLSGMLPGVTGLAVQQVVQRAYLHVTAWGTEAAAATGIGVGVSATTSKVRVVFDHPFLFLVRDTKTGAILFAAEVQNPAA